MNTNKQIKSKFKKLMKKYNNSRGWLLLAFVFFFFVLSAAAVMGPVLQNAHQLSNTYFEENIRRAEQILLTTNSPIRNYVVDELYKRLQQQLIDHLGKSGGSASYICQGVVVPPSSADPEGSKLENQFGLCEPEKLFDGMDGNTNQTIDFNKAFGIKLDPNSEDEDNNLAIRKIMAQNKNSYDYTLRTLFVRQELVEYGGIGKPRVERYHWLTRADVIATTDGANRGDIRQPLVIYYDVYLLNEFYPNQFFGAGSACNQEDSLIRPCNPDAQPGDIISTNDCLFTVITNPDGSALPATDYEAFGIDIKPNGECQDKGNGIRDCPIPGGRTLREIRIKSVRPQTGCASLNSGKTKIGPDPKGYSFTLTVRTVSIGSSYN